jgi:cytochrome c peroxidase
MAFTLARQSALAAPDPGELANLGRALFFDVNFSASRNQSCASCHDPARAFSDGRNNDVSGAVSLGGDGFSLGDRNAPSTTYAFLIPDFHKDDKNQYVGGYFHDGRAT